MNDTCTLDTICHVQCDREFLFIRIIWQTLNSIFSACSGPIFKILFSACSAECPLARYTKISSRESVRNAEFAKFDTRENLLIYSMFSDSTD